MNLTYVKVYWNGKEKVRERITIEKGKPTKRERIDFGNKSGKNE